MTIVNEHLTEEQARQDRLAALKESGIDPYPARAERGMAIEDARKSAGGAEVSICGRVLSKREMGKLTFSHVKDASGKIQAAFSAKEIGSDSYKFYQKMFDVGDFISLAGVIFTTHRGEISVMVKKFTLISKALLAPPEKFHGLANIELRYRQRYLDLMANGDSMSIAKTRSRVVREIRRYFDDLDFFEVETPVLQSLYGGANARPFVTHHNTLDADLYLRIAPELYLKRLIVGGFEKVYEIGKCFRNEGIDQNHNPEFTQIEFYWAYADYNKLMDLMEDLLPRLISIAGLSLKFKLNGQVVDFSPPYQRVPMRELIREYAKFDIEDFPDQSSLYRKCEKMRLENIDKTSGYGRLVDEVYKAFVRPRIVDPVFMIDHPVELSPLAKRKPDSHRYAERMQLICVGGNELCNGFSELNDPLDQEARFNEQERLRDVGDEESMPFDHDFVIALKYGMPPTAGLGMGIDRLIKLLVGAENLKEVILFPTLKPEYRKKL